MAGGPYQLLQWLGVKPTGFLLLVVPRLLLCTASFTIGKLVLPVCNTLVSLKLIDLCYISFPLDYLLYRIATKLQLQDPARVVLCFASSWPTLVFLTRTFSNTFETFVLALCFAVLLLCDRYKRVGFGGVFHLQTLLLGVLLAVGFFTRFTFVFFFFPLGLELVRSHDALLTESASKKDSDRHASVFKRVMAALFVALQGLLAFTACSLVFIVMDTVYFRPEMASDYQQWLVLDRQTLLKKVVVAPLNNLMYNLHYENLELHGVHARVTHFAVNMPMLFGPLFFRFLINVVTGNASNGNAHMPRHRQVFAVASVLFPLACISMAPHQEPRFLLPLLIPLQIFFASELLKRRILMAIWIAFNLALTVFFGVLHQGGVVPMLLSFSANGQHQQQQYAGMLTSAQLSKCHFTGDATALMGAIPIVFYKTYMPPRFLFAGMKASSNFQVVDLAGGSADAISTQLQRLQQHVISEASSVSEPTYQVFLVAPASVSVDAIVTSSFVSVSTRVGSCAPHISTEDLALDKPFALELHLLEMTEPVQ